MALSSQTSESVPRAISLWWRSALGRGKGPDFAARKHTNKRLRMTVIIVLVVALLLSGRLFYLQIIRADDLAAIATSFRSTTYTQEAKRGDITDLNGTVLATSVARYNVRADQVALQDYVAYADDGETILGAGPAAVAHELAPVLGMDEAELGGILRGKDHTDQWAIIKKGLSSDEWQQILALGIRGIYGERYMDREYPDGSTAGNILGYVSQSADDDTVRGRAGIEQQMDSILAGEDGSLSVQVGPHGTEFPDSEVVTKEAIDGRDVQLTIDADLQRESQKAIDAAVQKNGGAWGALVVLEIGTGRVLAMADSHTPDPSDLSVVDPSSWGNRSISSVYEPGSVGKLITLSAALDQKTVTAESAFTVKNPITMPNGEVIKDSSAHPTEPMSVAGIIAKSYNTGTVQIGDTLTDETRYAYMQNFGWGAKTGIDLPAEASGIMRPYDEWGPRDHYTTMFGQGVATTTIQLAQMVAVIGQKGVLIPPHIIESYQDESGEPVPTILGESRQVLSEQTAQQVLQIMEGVTQPGGGAPNTAIVEGYNVAGKTGTAQNADAAGNLSNGAGTFVGLVPSDNPRIAVAAVVYKEGAILYGASSAAPAFADVAAFAMREMKVPQSTEPLYTYQWYPGQENR